VTQRQQLGRLGERLARRHLESLGYQILDSNFRAAGGEIDLVAEKGDELVFVEVRTRRGRRLGTPEESVTPTKQAHIVAAALEYLQSTGSEDRDWRIDVIAVELDLSGRLLRLDVIENAVEQ
jgi:putative endonuclease